MKEHNINMTVWNMECMPHWMTKGNKQFSMVYHTNQTRKVCVLLYYVHTIFSVAGEAASRDIRQVRGCLSSDGIHGSASWRGPVDGAGYGT